MVETKAIGRRPGHDDADHEFVDIVGGQLRGIESMHACHVAI
jgi:hypothetical protein